MSLRSTMTEALRDRRLARGLSLAQVARLTGMARSGINTIEMGTTGTFLDHIEKLAEGLGARWQVALVAVDEAEPELELRHLAVAMAPDQLADLLRVVRAWARLGAHDRELVAHLAERQAELAPAGPAEVVELPRATGSRRKTG